MTNYRRQSIRSEEDRFIAEVFARGSDRQSERWAIKWLPIILAWLAGITFGLWLIWKY